MLYFLLDSYAVEHSDWDVLSFSEKPCLSGRLMGVDGPEDDAVAWAERNAPYEVLDAKVAEHTCITAERAGIVARRAETVAEVADIDAMVVSMDADLLRLDAEIVAK